jgi:hypothetical protein
MPSSIAPGEKSPTSPPAVTNMNLPSPAISEAQDDTLPDFFDRFGVLNITQNRAVQHRPKPRELISEISLLKFSIRELKHQNEQAANKFKELNSLLEEAEDIKWKLAVRAIELERRLLTAAEDMRESRRLFEQHGGIIKPEFGVEFGTSLPSSLEYHRPRKLITVSLNGPRGDHEEVKHLVSLALSTDNHSGKTDDIDDSTPMSEVEGALVDVGPVALDEMIFWQEYRDNPPCMSP